jgi:hypothetical protein
MRFFDVNGEVVEVDDAEWVADAHRKLGDARANYERAAGLLGQLEHLDDPEVQSVALMIADLLVAGRARADVTERLVQALVEQEEED